MYISANTYYRQKFGCKIYRLSLSGGMTCPNRDGTLGTRGCIFCSGYGSGDFAAHDEHIEKQIASAKQLVSGKTDESCKFIAYFQDFTNTYAPVEHLRRLFTEATAADDIVGLSVATRPDCLPDEVTELLCELNEKKPVWIELGLQTVHESTARYIRRGYDLRVYDDAMSRLRACGIDVITHMIIGLPHETKEQMIQTAKYISDAGSHGIKLQLLHVLRGTDLQTEYERGAFDVLTLEEYIDILKGCVAVLRDDIVVYRLTGDGAKKDLIAPLWSADKKRVLAAVHKAKL